MEMVDLNKEEILNWDIKKLMDTIPLAESVLLEYGIEIDPDDTSVVGVKLAEWAQLRNRSIESLLTDLLQRVNEFEKILETKDSIVSLTIIGGCDKNGQKESVESVVLRPGDIIALVGPTGSGKSRLLADIEWIAERDTPSKRLVAIESRNALKKRDKIEGQKLIAQLSQTMSFVLDATVGELLELHAESRGCSGAVITETINAANELSGEQFSETTGLTNLSGGQTRALMVADTAIISASPIVLIDELENAGIDRKKAFELLVSNDKIVLLSTHDPLLALLAGRRICMANGAMSKVCIRSAEEMELLSGLERMDAVFSKVRAQIRSGETIIINYDPEYKV